MLALLLLATVAAFAATRAVRAQEDIVNTVELPSSLAPGEVGTISFDLSEPEPRAAVLVVAPDGDTIRALAVDRSLPAGRQRFRWGGGTDRGGRAPPGRYRLRVVLESQGRDISPPGTIRVEARG